MRISPILVFGLFCTPLLCPARSSAQDAPAPLRYAFSESFPTQFSPKDGDGFRAQGIAVDDGGQVYLTAKGEGIVEFDAQRKYHFSFGYPAPEEERDGVDQNGNPETGEDMPLSQRAYLRSADGKPFVVMPDAKTLSIAGYLFDPRPVAVNAAGQVSTIDVLTNWFQVFTGQGLAAYFQIPTSGGSFSKFLGFAEGKGTTPGPTGKSSPTLFVLNASQKCITLFDGTITLGKSFGGPGSGTGQLSSPSCLAINAEKTLLFVGDGSRVMVYRTDGTFISAFGSQGDKPGQFTTITALACTKAGHVFVLEGGRLQVFSEKGDYLGQVAGRQGGGAASPLASLNYADAVAVDASETAYVVDQSLVKIYKRVP